MARGRRGRAQKLRYTLCTNKGNKGIKPSTRLIIETCADIAKAIVRAHARERLQRRRKRWKYRDSLQSS
jgi:hypothetical protein